MSYKTPDQLVLAVIRRLNSQPVKDKKFGQTLAHWSAEVLDCTEQQARGLCISYGFDPDVKVWNPFRRSAI